MPEFHIRIAGDELAFGAAHFITTAEGCELLHGHTYRVSAEVFGPLDEHQCVADFLMVREALRAIVGRLNHRVLLPAQHPQIRLREQGPEIEAVCGERRWVFPRDNCLMLPLANTTTELLARHVAEQLCDRLSAPHGAAPKKIRVEIAESSGASAICDLDAHEPLNSAGERRASDHRATA
jgi:6-pyruvoyltetrahydropterin/6-carboxytetrahydropterin synthase